MKKLSLIFLLSAIFASCSNDNDLARKADRLHKCFLTVDTHCDTPLLLVSGDYDLGKRNDEACVDFPRMKEGGLDAEFFAVFLAQGPRNEDAYNIVYQKTLEIFDSIHSNVRKNSSVAELALTPDDACRLKKENKISAFIGVENGYAIGLETGRIKEFYDLGARYITLCHSNNNDICDSSTDPRGAEHNGLSVFGEEVVKEMNRIGMMVDVSHISDEAFYDVIRISEAPVIASHSSCRALCSSPRNLTDDMLHSLKSNGGVIQICILSSYIRTPEPNPEMDARLEGLRLKYGEFGKLSEEQKKLYRKEMREIFDKHRKLATVADVLDHIDHVIQVIGVDHVGIGTDFDGGGGVEGCMTVDEMKNITIEMLHRGYSNKDIKKIWGGNIMRVMREVQEHASI
jgi:membrane dipeptidase